MSKTLVILESPGKIKKIQSYLGSDYIIKASFGHLRDLDEKEMSVDIEHDFKPIYKISKDKTKVVGDLKQALTQCNDVILATDCDREGEAIADGIAVILKLNNPKRMLFSEITKTALESAIKNCTVIDKNKVQAQQARRILDRIVGFKLSPLLWKKLSYGSSAGRVQSVVVKIIIDRENDINKFSSESYFKGYANFYVNKENDDLLKTVLFKINNEKKKSDMFNGSVIKIENEQDAKNLLEIFSTCTFNLYNTCDKISMMNPSAPFTTSTLQQEASHKCGFTCKKTMMLAQKLYEGGHITYMRTDSVCLCDESMESIKQEILSKYGENYYRKKIYATKAKNAQEAHEAIRPTHIENSNISGESDECKLYQLIWKRTIASQMSPAKINNTEIQISITQNKKILQYYYSTIIKNILFDGFLCVYHVSLSDDEDTEETNENIKIPIKGTELDIAECEMREEYTKTTGRYTEASLIKKLEDVGIGRPSTYVSFISKIQERNYVVKTDIPGNKVNAITLFLDENGVIKSKNKELLLGKEINKLVPTDFGKNVNSFLIKNFTQIMDYDFTAKLEKELDLIMEGKQTCLNVLKTFYGTFSPIIDTLMETEENQTLDEKLGKYIGDDPKTGQKIYADMAKYGAVVKRVELTKTGKTVRKSTYAPLKDIATVDTVTLEQALELLKYPYLLGKYNNQDIIVQKGKFGLYLKYDDRNVNISDNIDINNLTIEIAEQLIKEKGFDKIIKLQPTNKRNKAIYEIITNGQYGPYIKVTSNKKKTNIKIPTKFEDPTKITAEEIELLIEENKTKKPYKKFTKKPTASNNH